MLVVLVMLVLELVVEDSCKSVHTLGAKTVSRICLYIYVFVYEYMWYNLYDLYTSIYVCAIRLCHEYKYIQFEANMLSVAEAVASTPRQPA